ncbi:hypothetical protein C8F04DRAFT_1388713 [Mycena alexandri]|uniref:Small nuclear ribonucleoprotein Prp3 C-terminal domain-containing protein n=1 Tax=Mycena alexandri TaxID=1745969 RepID=A0AAD6TFM8_9AGAR|nr:hypothetical protein C8F04DRAFT_1388713 [Mycena alexandri]
MNTAQLPQHLEELQLIQFTLLPGEILTFLDHEGAVWTQLLQDYADGVSTENSRQPMAPPHVQVKPQDSKIWFELQFSASEEPTLSVSVKGENLARSEQERWQSLVLEKMDEIGTSDFPAYQLLCLHLLPLLHDESPAPAVEEHPVVDIAEPGARFHALFTSHHLISPKKRRSLQQWSNSLSVAGFAKVGYPGVIYLQGAEGSVEEFVANVKAMQWLALRLRFLESLPSKDGDEAQGWTEFEKVGEAVEMMRRLGLEDWIVEMGIGSRTS